MGKTFKINKEEIVNRLSKVEGVKIINTSVLDEVREDYEGTIWVLYQFKDKTGKARINKSIEFKNMIKDLITSPDMDIHIVVRATDSKMLVCEGNLDYGENEDIFEVE